MPIFEYLCEECGETFERILLSGRPIEARCPGCSSGRAARVPSAFSCLGVQLDKKFRMEAEEGLKKERRY